MPISSRVKIGLTGSFSSSCLISTLLVFGTLLFGLFCPLQPNSYLTLSLLSTIINLLISLFWLYSISLTLNFVIILLFETSSAFKFTQIKGAVYNSLPIPTLKHARLKASEACPFSASVLLSVPTSSLQTQHFFSVS